MQFKEKDCKINLKEWKIDKLRCQFKDLYKNFIIINDEYQ
jgi:hypothetical protein